MELRETFGAIGSAAEFGPRSGYDAPSTDLS